ncbi:MAG: hypothetical protein DI529_09915 [Chryseobacterium sp.]|nr:MAG: hypothetical protein DI529_09915 [Chryseobacterium sp.]
MELLHTTLVKTEQFAKRLIFQLEVEGFLFLRHRFVFKVFFIILNRELLNSPDCNGILFLFSQKRKRYSGKRD